MTLPENITEAPTTSALAWPARTQPIAPWWHTALLVVIILGISALGGLHAKPAKLGGHHIAQYVVTIVWEWVLALIAWWGLRMQGTPIRQVLGRRRVGVKEWFRDFGIALVFWIIAIIILGAVASALRFSHLMHATPKTVLALAPQTIVQLLVWIALCCTAGIVEEFVFRGYLLQQFSSIGGKVWIGVVVSSLLFGAGHGYEGIGAMIVIAVYGALFCVLAIRRESLRAGMIAHAWHDSITGVALAIAKHAHLI